MDWYLRRLLKSLPTGSELISGNVLYHKSCRLHIQVCAGVILKEGRIASRIVSGH